MAKYRVNGKWISEKEWNRRIEEANKADPGRLDFLNEIGGHAPGGDSSSGWPMASDASGVHPEQVPEAMDLIKKKAGVSCDFTKDGRPVFTSEAHKVACIKAMGMFCRSSGKGMDSRTYEIPPAYNPELSMGMD